MTDYRQLLVEFFSNFTNQIDIKKLDEDDFYNPADLDVVTVCYQILVELQKGSLIKPLTAQLGENEPAGAWFLQKPELSEHGKNLAFVDFKTEFTRIMNKELENYSVARNKEEDSDSDEEMNIIEEVMDGLMDSFNVMGLDIKMQKKKHKHSKNFFEWKYTMCN